MERLLHGPGWRREEQRYQPAPSSQRLVRTPALSRAASNGGPAPKPGHSSRHFSPEMPLRMTNEKELLRGLNDRFAGFIETVHRLESQNRALEREIEEIRLKAKSTTALAKQYEPELQDLRRQVGDMVVQKYQVELEQKRVEDEFNALREKCEQEARSRGESEQSIAALKKYIDNAYLAKEEMDRKARALEDEIEFLKRNHEAEVSEILTQMKETRVPAEVSGFGKGELTAALRDIRAQLEGRAFCADSHTEQRFNNQLAKLTKAAETDREALITTKAEISQNRKQLQSKNVELDSVRGMREALERQLYDLEQRHTAEIHHYQDTIRELEQELKNTKYDMSSHVQEYQDLLNVKMALDAEIYSYRKLLEGEESRYSTLSDAQMPVPYVYRQSPIYTLPSVPRVGGVTRKAEPQYKFVEEIITETTREDIEISDTGSEDGEEQKESDKVFSETENADIPVPGEEDLVEEKTKESDTQEKTEQLDEEKSTENVEEEQSLKESTDVSTDFKEGEMDTKSTQNNVTTPELPEEKETDEADKVGDTDSKTQEPDLDTKTEKPQAETSTNEDVEKVALDLEKGKQDIAKEIDQASMEQPKPTEQTAGQEDITDPGKHAVEEMPPKSEDEKAKEETQHVDEPEDSSTEKMMEKVRESDQVKSVEVDASTADPQPVSQKAEAGEEKHPTSKADSKQSVETSQADVLDTTKEASAEDNAVEVQKELAEKVETDTPQKSEVVEQKSEEKKMEGKTEVDTKTETGKRDSLQSTEAQESKEEVSKPAAEETKVEPSKTSEKKEIQTKDVMDKTKIDTETVDTGKGDSLQSTEAKHSKEEVSKPAAEQTKVEPSKTSEKKEIHTKDVMDKTKIDTETVDTGKRDSLQSTEAQESKEEVFKPAAEETKVEPYKTSEKKEIQTKDVMDKTEIDTETVDTGKGDSLQSTEAKHSKEEVSKPAAEQTKVEPSKTSEKKEIHTKDVMDSAKKEESTEAKETEKEVDQMQIKEAPKVAGIETKSEGEPPKNEDGPKENIIDKDLKTEETVITKTSEIPKEDIQKDKETKSTEKETKDLQKTVKTEKGPEAHEPVTSEDITLIDTIHPKVQETESKSSKDVQPEQIVPKTSPEKEQSKDKISTEKDSQVIQDTKIEKSDKTESSEVKQDSTKVDTTKSLEKDPTPQKDSEKPAPTDKGHVSSEKGQDNSMKADLKKERDVPAVTENGENI